MKETDILNDDASLQFQNIFKAAFIIIIDESKEEFIDVFKEYGLYYDSISILQNYRDVQLNSFSENFNIINISEPKSLNINGLSAEIVEMDCDLDDIKISYIIAYIEGKDKLYLIMTWTTLDKKEKYLNTFYQEIKSFKEI